MSRRWPSEDARTLLQMLRVDKLTARRGARVSNECAATSRRAGCRLQADKRALDGGEQADGCGSRLSPIEACRRGGRSACVTPKTRWTRSCQEARLRRFGHRATARAVTPLRDSRRSAVPRFRECNAPCKVGRRFDASHPACEARRVARRRSRSARVPGAPRRSDDGWRASRATTTGAQIASSARLRVPAPNARRRRSATDRADPPRRRRSHATADPDWTKRLRTGRRETARASGTRPRQANRARHASRAARPPLAFAGEAEEDDRTSGARESFRAWTGLRTNRDARGDPARSAARRRRRHWCGCGARRRAGDRTPTVAMLARGLAGGASSSPKLV